MSIEATYGTILKYKAFAKRTQKLRVRKSTCFIQTLQILQVTCCKEVIWNSLLLYWVREERHNSVFCTDPWNRTGDCTRGI